jgi:hypothetical protein
MVMLMIVLVFLLFLVWQIVKRTGHSGWWSLLIFIPLAEPTWFVDSRFRFVACD